MLPSCILNIIKSFINIPFSFCLDYQIILYWSFLFHRNTPVRLNAFEMHSISYKWEYLHLFNQNTFSHSKKYYKIMINFSLISCIYLNESDSLRYLATLVFFSSLEIYDKIFCVLISRRMFYSSQNDSSWILWWTHLLLFWWIIW